MKSFAIKLSGPAGVGMMQAGETLSKALNRLGFYSLMYPEYPSRIRGGDNSVLVVFSEEKYISPVEKIDLLLAFERENFERHEGELEVSEVSKVSKEKEEKELNVSSPFAKATEDKKVSEGYEAGELGLLEIAKELGNPLVASTAGLGFIFKVLGFELKVLEEQIKEEFEGKEEILKLNLEAARRGYEIGVGMACLPARQGSEKWPAFAEASAGKEVGKKIVNLSGNEALVEGILKADCRFAAIYPMTPINSILTMLARLAEDLPRGGAGGESRRVQVFRPEDEIAGIMVALGASYAGKRAMIATSGGGFSLMVEGLGMAGMAEIPLVCVVGQRTGPSTGMATFSSQADLNFVINAGQGEFPRIILAPGDINECRRLGEEAFYLAEKYQVPVILLTDKYLAESRFSIDDEELKVSKVSNVSKGNEGKELNVSKVSNVLEDYKRYQFTKDGISPRAFPGQTIVRANSYEHDEEGFSCDEKENRIKMMKKRMGKLRGLEGGFTFYKGQEEPEGQGNILVGWGSTKEIILDFLKNHPELNYLHIWRPWPFPKEAIEILKKSEKVVVIEGNYSGQLADLIERFTFKKVGRILKDDGRPFTKREIELRIKY